MRLSVFMGIIIGSVGYQIVRAIVGLPVSIESVFSAVYWSGAALGIHWWASRPKKSRRLKES